jgi:DNA-binding NarL/FixJ family response regulator
MNSKRVIILDDHTLFLKGMTLILKECCADCDIYPYQSIAKLKSDKLDFKEFDLLISDIEMPNEDTFALFTALKRKYKKLPILVVSMHKKNAIIKKCKAIGIDGYLLKDEDEQLTVAVETIINGEEYYSSTIIEFCKKTQDTFVKMSKREEEVIKLIAKGYSNVEISSELFVSAETIKTHKKNIKLKLETENISDITKYAKKNFLI